MDPSEDPSWANYRQTILELFPEHDPLRIDLRRPVSDETRAALRNRGVPETFASITACNPRGRTVDDDENRRRAEQLTARLRSMGQWWIGADGMSPDERHREPGVAVDMARDDARRLATEFEQSAIYWFDGEAFWVVGALVDSAPIRLPR